MAVGAGHVCTVKQTGAAVAMTGEACSAFSSAIYHVTNASKRVLDAATPLVVYDNGTPVVPVFVSYVSGLISMGYTPTGPVTVDGAYLPLMSVAEATSFEINFERALLDSSTIGSEVRARQIGLRDFKGQLTTRDTLLTDLGDGTTTFDDQQSGTRRLLEVTFPSGHFFRGYARFSTVAQKSEEDGIFETTISFEGSVFTTASPLGSGTFAIVTPF